MNVENNKINVNNEHVNILNKYTNVFKRPRRGNIETYRRVVNLKSSDQTNEDACICNSIYYIQKYIWASEIEGSTQNID